MTESLQILELLEPELLTRKLICANKHGWMDGWNVVDVKM